MTIQTKIKELFNRKKEVSNPKVTKTKAKPMERIPAHQHLWKVVGKTYAPAANINIASGNMSIPEKVLEKAIFGVTTLLWECICGETKREELLGSDEDLLESLVNKSDKIGPQFIERLGKTFIISEWKTQQQNPNMVPLK